MATRQTIADHQQAATTHDAESKCWGKLAECFGAMEKAKQDGDMVRIAAHCGTMKKIHSDAADYHASCAKSDSDQPGKTIQPDSISSIPRTDVPESGFGFFAIPRRGAPPVSELDKTVLDRIAPEFRHLISSDE